MIHLYVRYQDDGHLGSLRSPLRADTERMGRYRLRHGDQSRQVEPRWRDGSRLQSGRGTEDSEPQLQWRGATRLQSARGIEDSEPQLRWRGATRLQSARGTEDSSHTWQLDRYERCSVVIL